MRGAKFPLFVGMVCAVAVPAWADWSPVGQLLDTLTVDSDGTIETSSVVLQSGKTYYLVAGGTYTFKLPADQYPADAEWFQYPDWGPGWFETWTADPQQLDLVVDGIERNWWGSPLAAPDPLNATDFATFAPHIYSPSHVYVLAYQGQGSAVQLHIVDTLYSDNAGSLAVSIYASQPAKYFQLPDLTMEGMDVNATEPFILADDFPCEVTGPITDIHVWGSWYHDWLPHGEDPELVLFILSIHEDIPADQSPTEYSMPGDVLWWRVFQPGEFTARLYAGGLEEGWLDPPDMYEPDGDTECWQYNFFIDEADAFWQEGTPDEPVVYWLDVQAIPEDPQARFGWKTSLDHWNDDAVWADGVEPYFGPWWELRYPPEHPMYPESIDLAFVITTSEEKPWTFLFEFSQDIGADTELDDPQMDGDEGFDPGDVYWWRSAPVNPPFGRDGFKDDMQIFGHDPAPDPPLPGPGPVDPEFDLDGHDEIDVDLTQFGLPDIDIEIPQWNSPCIYDPEFLYISFDDDMAPGWWAGDVPVTVPSSAGNIYGTTAGIDEVLGLQLALGPVPPYPLVSGPAGILDEVSIHQSMWPNPDAGDPEDDDVDSLDLVCSEDQCPYWYFTADHEAPFGLDPGDIYLVSPMAPAWPILVIDAQFNLGLIDGTDVDAFEFTWIDLGHGPVLAVLFSVDEDDTTTAVDESGGLDPWRIYYSILNGSHSPLFYHEPPPAFDDIDALTIWPRELPLATAWRSVRFHGGPVSANLPIVLDPLATGSAVVSETRRNGIQQIEVDLTEAVTVIGPLQAVDTGTLIPYPVTGWSLINGNQTLVMNWIYPAIPQPTGLPDQACYTIDLAGSVVGVASGMLVGDTDCMVRGLTGDTNNDQNTNLIDMAQTKSKNGQPVVPGHIRFDVNVDGNVNLIDMALVKSLNGNSASCP